MKESRNFKYVKAVSRATETEEIKDTVSKAKILVIKAKIGDKIIENKPDKNIY